MDEKVQFLTDHHHDLLNQRAALDNRLKEAKALGREVAATHIAAEVSALLSWAVHVLWMIEIVLCIFASVLLPTFLYLYHCPVFARSSDQREHRRSAGQQHKGEGPAARELLHQPRAQEKAWYELI